MDLQGSLVDTNLKIYPSKEMVKFLESLSGINSLPKNILSFIKGKNCIFKTFTETETKVVTFTDEDITNLKKIKDKYSSVKQSEDTETTEELKNNKESESNTKRDKDENELKENEGEKFKSKADSNKSEGCYLTLSDIDWLYEYIKEQKANGENNIPYLHVLLDGADIDMPENPKIKRNPALEARCVKLRAQQEAREYKKMTKSVDNVRMRFPDDSISYQLKQVNRQLIAVGQFIISIFAGFLFGFKGVEWMVGNLDFGFRLLLGVMCALVIALAEIYFLAKKLNEELNIPETVQLGGPLKFADAQNHTTSSSNKVVVKEHQD